MTDASQSTEPSYPWWQQGGGISQEREGKREEREYKGLCQHCGWGHLGVCWEFSLPHPLAYFPVGGKGRAPREGGRDMVLGEWEGDADCGAQRGSPLAPREPQA